MDSRLFHQEVEEFSHDDTEEFLYRPGDEGRKELEQKEIDKSVKGQGVTFHHANPRSSTHLILQLIFLVIPVKTGIQLVLDFKTSTGYLLSQV
jgi:hypothetical protein